MVVRSSYTMNEIHGHQPTNQTSSQAMHIAAVELSALESSNDRNGKEERRTSLPRAAAQVGGKVY